MVTLTFEATRFVWPALRSIIFCFAVIVILLMAMVKPAQAQGTLPDTSQCTLFNWNLGYSMGIYASNTAACAAVGATVLWGDLSGDCTKQAGYFSCSAHVANASCSAGVCTCNTGYVPDSTGKKCVVASTTTCPPNTAGTPPTCACIPGYSPYPYYSMGCFAPPTCPSNMHGTPPSCTCDTGFVPNPGGAGCVPLTCNTGYKPDPTGTSCIPDPYTIALSGLGGEVMPTKTRDAYALVTTGSGAPKSGAQVKLDLKVVPELQGQLPVTFTGTLNTYSGTTGADGRLSFVFTAPTAGGTHTITATCTNCTNQATGTIKVPGCPESPLTELTDPVAIDFDNGSRWHPEGLTPTFQAHLACVETAITTAGGTYTPTSAYRPEQYQRHLFEIVQKDKKLKPRYMTAHPECQALRDEVTGEMGPSPGHALRHKQKVATPGTSPHEKRVAFDLTPHGLTDAQLAPIYTGCGVSHTAVSGEPWHVQ